ncbi:2OG-Fe dioxygenase family protein [Pseudomonas typographi]|uniref:2OG-Fe dioxygenase family protein n=1 Tax=Pseudomonas typographi TaxID=2715964 RepID=A0ABR7Z804_9PSED|nr:2OG-Fe dioxygenase family protein [Pseudomonas typographi]MBD1554557.1 2OG-Fe dioxygenase family protein [Pseudomonas typographi]MBD1588620.1 2OG-Fe dioxygenase family protein [Pseudomonas typographi]MBD1601590.1 2OG-Fe dioxygenase family protein [Pseudomonas typographi]
MTVACTEIVLDAHAVTSISDDISKQGWAYRDGQGMAQRLNLDPDSWEDFSRYWENLALDEYMADQGTYRYRRYSEFDFKVGGALHKLPHAAYEQATYINTLNGGVARHFLPLEDGMVEHPLFIALLAGIARVFDRVEGATCDWNIRLHPYRIVTNEFEQGKPTPEGRHRDGVDYIVMMLVRRTGITGGTTRVSTLLNKTLCEVTLANGLDVIMGDDRQIMHEVSPINCQEIGRQGYRDALVIAFTRKGV